MKNLFENKILDDLYEIREGEVEKQYIAKYGEPEETEKTRKAENELIEFMEKFIKNEKEMEELYGKINKFEICATSEMCFWFKPYYKAGFINAISLKKQIEEEQTKDNNTNDSIIQKNMLEILDFAEDQKYKNLKINARYNEIINEIEEIKNNYKKVKLFFEDEQITELTKEESKAIFDIIELENEINVLGQNEMFKIGLREGKAL